MDSRNNQTTLRTVTLVAKGPSASNAKNVLRKTDALAVVNDAGKLIPDRQIDYLFFAHETVYPLLAHAEGRVSKVISRRLNQTQHDLMPEWLQPLHEEFDDYDCDGDYPELIQRLVSGGIMMHHTTTAAIHWLARNAKFERIRIIGVDGGEAYANGLQKTPSVESNLDDFRQITKRVANICRVVYDVDIEWYEL